MKVLRFIEDTKVSSPCCSQCERTLASHEILESTADGLFEPEPWRLVCGKCAAICSVCNVRVWNIDLAVTGKHPVCICCKTFGPTDVFWCNPPPEPVEES